jgi:hypothetical protein
MKYLFNFELQSTFKYIKMNRQQDQLESIQEIRTLMERSSKFLSLSGLAGVFVGIFAILGVVAAYIYLGIAPDMPGYYHFATNDNGSPNIVFYQFFLSDATIVLSASLIVGSLMAIRKAKNQNQLLWDNTAKRLLINLLIPLFAGGIYCLILLYHGQIALLAPATLIFYGLALVHASKYTINDIRYMGLLNIVLGLFATLFLDYALLFWALGFGVLHIVYGLSIYFKYEK